MLNPCLAVAAVEANSRVGVVVALCLFTFSFSVSWAGVFFVLISELFSMSAKSGGMAAALAVLFLSGSITDTLFLTALDTLGPFALLLFAAIAAGGGVFVFIYVPETRGRTILEVQTLLAGR